MPPGSINDEIESELAAYGYAVARSDRLWIGGYRVHSPESILFGNYRPYVPPSNFTCVASRSVHVPDARDFDLEAVLEERGELFSNGQSSDLISPWPLPANSNEDHETSQSLNNHHISFLPNSHRLSSIDNPPPCAKESHA